MSETEAKKPATLPIQYREPEPEPPKTVGRMVVGTTGYVDPKAIHIDANYGVWIDPDSVVDYSGPQSKPVRVDRTTDGYSVFLGYAYNHMKKKWKKTLPTSYTGAGYQPVDVVN